MVVREKELSARQIRKRSAGWMKMNSGRRTSGSSSTSMVDGRWAMKEQDEFCHTRDVDRSPQMDEGIASSLFSPRARNGSSKKRSRRHWNRRSR